MKTTSTIIEALANSPIGVIKGVFRSNIPLEVLWGLTIIWANPDIQQFEDDIFHKWIKSTWGITPKRERLKKMVIPYINTLGGWKLKLQLSDGQVLQTLQFPISIDETDIISLGTVDTTQANKVSYRNHDFWLLLEFAQPLLKATHGEFIVKSLDKETFFVQDQMHDMLYSHPVPLM